MRSEMVFAAEHSLPNRYMLCRVLATATRKVHKPATRIEDTTDAILRRIANSNAGSTVAGQRRHCATRRGCPLNVYSRAGWRQCPNAGTPGSRGFASFRPTLGWLSPRPKRTPIFQPKRPLQ